MNAIRTVIPLVATLTLCACTSAPPPSVIEYFDEVSVTSISRSSATVDFISRRRGISMVGGDMITVGPVYATLAADQDLYLWMGFWTTLDRFRLQEDAPQPPERVDLDIDGQILTLERRSLYTPVEGTRSRIYPAPSPGVQDAYYAITLEDMDRVHAASALRIRIAVDGGGVIVYEAQAPVAPMLASFIDYTG